MRQGLGNGSGKERERKPVAENWMKVEESTPDKPEIAILARKLGVSLGDAFLQWFRLYRWAGRITADGFVRSVSGSDADALAGAMPGTCEALGCAAVGWIELRPDGLQFTKWDRHNSKSAKARGLDAIYKRSKRDDVRQLSGCEPDKTRDRQEGDKRENLLKSPIGQLGPVGRLPKKFSRKGFKADLSSVDWSEVMVKAEAVGKRIRPMTETDRRNWFKFAVLAQTTFCEAWLMDGVDAVLHAKETKRTKQAHLYAVLRSKAEEAGVVNGEFTFSAMLGSIEVPKDVWKSGVLEIAK